MGGGPPGFPPGSSCPVVLWILPCQYPFRLQDYYLLWCVFPYTSAKNIESILQSATPKILLSLVWPLSLSLAATLEIDVSFFSSSYLDVSVQRVSSPRGVTGLLPAGLSHSDICGSSLVCKSPQLFAAYHVLLSLHDPRHPPYALTYFLFPLCIPYCIRIAYISSP